MHQDTLFAAPFVLNRLAVTGAPQPVLEDIQLAGLSASANFAFSETGTVVYLSGKGTRSHSQSIFWLDSAGKTQPLRTSHS